MILNLNLKGCSLFYVLPLIYFTIDTLLIPGQQLYKLKLVS